MRAELKEREGRREKFSGTFARLGHKKGWKGKQLTTILLTDIKDGSGAKLLTDHLWLNSTKGIESLGELKEGEVIGFEARVSEYIKGYRGYRDDEQIAYEHPVEKDYRLSFPNNFKRIITQSQLGEQKGLDDANKEPKAKELS